MITKYEAARTLKTVKSYLTNEKLIGQKKYAAIQELVDSIRCIIPILGESEIMGAIIKYYLRSEECFILNDQEIMVGEHFDYRKIIGERLLSADYEEFDIESLCYGLIGILSCGAIDDVMMDGDRYSIKVGNLNNDHNLNLLIYGRNRRIDTMKILYQKYDINDAKSMDILLGTMFLDPYYSNTVKLADRLRLVSGMVACIHRGCDDSADDQQHTQ